MDQRSICLFLAIKGFSVQDILNEFASPLGPDAIAYPIMSKCPSQWEFHAVPCCHSEKPPNTVIENAIPDALEKQPFSSIRELAKLTCIPTVTVHRHLTQSLGLVVKSLRWVSHSRTNTQKAQSVTLSNRLLRKLRSIKHQEWQLIITFDELWFYLTTDYEPIWLRPDQELPKTPKHTIQDKRIIMMIAWDRLAFHVLELFQKAGHLMPSATVIIFRQH
jgi:hypothetical protein